MVRPDSLKDPTRQRELGEDGFCVVDVTEEALAGLEALYRRIRPDVLEGFTASIQVEDGSYRHDAHHGVRAATKAMVSELFTGHRVVAGNFVVKQPGPWVVEPHQDFDFTDESRWAAVLAWIPLHDAEASGGCLTVIRGSHLWPTLPRGSGDHRFPYGGEMDRLRDLAEPVPLRRGQAVLYDARTFHGSGPNLGDRERVAGAFAAIPREAPLLHHHVNPDDTVTVVAVDDDVYADTPFHGYPVRGEIRETRPLVLDEPDQSSV